KTMRSICHYSLLFIFTILLVVSKLSAQSVYQENGTQARLSALIQDFDSLYIAEPERARGLIYQALHTSKKGGFIKEQAESYYRLGKLYFNIGKYDSARTCIEIALPIFEN